MTHFSVAPIPILKDNYVWTVVNKMNNTALVVDPGEATSVRDYLEQHHLALASILITHHHWDHTNGISELIKIYDVPVFGPSEKITGVNIIVNDKHEVNVPTFSVPFRVIAIPGHTLGHIAYYGQEMLFCGDTLFASGCGRLFEGTPVQMYTSLQKIAALPDTTQIHCGHEYTLKNLQFASKVEPHNQKILERIKQVTEMRANHLPSLPSTLALEKETNPFLRCGSKELITHVEQFAGRKLNDAIEVFTWLRRWKDEF